MSPFKFKQFTIEQDRCAMKIGTDSVLLGAWTSLSHQPNSILDIGAGTGILSLMMAQRSEAQIIDAIELEDEAYEQCTDNFENSPWSDRLFCYHASLDEFTTEIDDTYDLIICNPPYFSEDFKSKNNQRDKARFQDAMPFDQLIESVNKLLHQNGKFSVVIPISEERNFINLAKLAGLFPERILHVKGNPESKIKRSLIQFSMEDKLTSHSDLAIETERHVYTDEYINLTKDFYLKM